MKEFKSEYNNLKNSINHEKNTKLVSFLILGILIGRVIEKFRNFKKKFRRK